MLAGQPLRRQVIGATCALADSLCRDLNCGPRAGRELERAEEAQAQAASVAATAASYTLNQYLNGLDSMASRWFSIRP